VHPSPRTAATGLLSTLLLTACSQTPGGSADAAGPGVKEREIPPIRPCVVERREMVSVLDATSRLVSEREVELYPELPGLAVEVMVEEGDSVRQGDLLARLDHRDEDLDKRDAEVALKEAKDALVVAELAVEEALGALEDAARAARQAEKDYDRDEQLYESTSSVSPLSQAQLEARLLERDNARYAEDLAKIMVRRRKLERSAAETGIERSQVSLDRAIRNRQKKDFVAPFDGVISRRNIRVGDSSGTSEPAFVLTDTTNLRAEFSRPQEELDLFARLGAGNGHGEELSIQATAEAYPGRVFEGYVERISPTIDADSGQFRVVARLRETDAGETRGRELLPGMLVRMEIVTDRHPDALVVPKRALRREGERRYVLVVQDLETGPTLERVDVDEAFEDDDSVEIVPRPGHTLDVGDTVVMIGSRDLREGDPVRIDQVSEEAADDPAEAAVPANVADVADVADMDRDEVALDVAEPAGEEPAAELDSE
jgi:membrane fusion protein (multidrug efflux system)